MGARPAKNKTAAKADNTSTTPEAKEAPEQNTEEHDSDASDTVQLVRDEFDEATGAPFPPPYTADVHTNEVDGWLAAGKGWRRAD